MRSFDYDALPGRILFGVGSLDRLSDEVASTGASKVFVVTDPATEGIAGSTIDRLGDRLQVCSRTSSSMCRSEVSGGPAISRGSETLNVLTVGGGVDDGVREGAFVGAGDPAHRGPHHVCRFRDDAHLRHHVGWS